MEWEFGTKLVLVRGVSSGLRVARFLWSDDVGVSSRVGDVAVRRTVNRVLMCQEDTCHWP